MSRVILETAAALLDQGFAVHWLHAKQKRPVGNDWQNAPFPTQKQLSDTYQNGYNLGLRLGEPSRLCNGMYLHVVDVDIRINELAEEAVSALRELLPVNPDNLPMVRSGSGGASFHLYFVSDKPFRSKLLITSDGKHRGADGKWHYDFEAELFGTGKQVVLPPSIHPSGKPYTWERPFDPFDMEFADAYTVSSDDLARLAVVEHTDYQYETVVPLDFKKGVMERLLDDLPVSDMHYDDWLRLGQALHHQLGGTEEGFQLWLAHTERSDKHDGKNATVRTMRMKWRSFGKYRGRPVTMATISQWAKDARIDAMADEFDDLEDIDDEQGNGDGDLYDGMFDTDSAGDTAGVSGDSSDEPDPFEPATDKPIRWRELLDMAETGAIKDTLPNIVLIIANDPRTKGVIRQNIFADKLVQAREPGRKKQGKDQTLPTLQLGGGIWKVRDTVNGDPWHDNKDIMIRWIIEAPVEQGGYGVKVSDRNLIGAITKVATQDSFHPVQEYLKALKWDGQMRVERLFIDYLKTPNNAYYRDVARLTLLAAVTRVFEPGHKFDSAPILEGLQGRRKSTFIRVLGKDWSAELDGDFSDDRAMMEKMQGAWLMEIPELSGFSKSEVNHVKAFMSRQEDRSRLAYDRRVTVSQRQCVFMGSTNDKKYLKDDTGGRRFWPIECTLGADEEIDTDKLEHNVDQLWAEAYQMYVTMRQERPFGTLPLYIADKGAATIASALQESRRIEGSADALRGMVEEWLNEPIHSGDIDNNQPTKRNKTCAMEVWIDCMGGDRKIFPHIQQNAINKVLRSLDGWKEVGQRRFGKQLGVQKAYVRIGSGEDV